MGIIILIYKMSDNTPIEIYQLAQVNQYAFFGFMGIASALIFANLGAAYGTARSGVGICSIGVLNPDIIFKSLIPGIMAGIVGDAGVRANAQKDIYVGMILILIFAEALGLY